jgi:hypothetical protein
MFKDTYPAQCIRVTPYKLVLYKPGDHFDTHRDTTHSRDDLATAVLDLTPCAEDDTALEILLRSEWHPAFARCSDNPPAAPSRTLKNDAVVFLTNLPHRVVPVDRTRLILTCRVTTDWTPVAATPLVIAERLPFYSEDECDTNPELAVDLCDGTTVVNAEEYDTDHESDEADDEDKDGANLQKQFREQYRQQLLPPLVAELAAYLEKNDGLLIALRHLVPLSVLTEAANTDAAIRNLRGYDHILGLHLLACGFILDLLMVQATVYFGDGGSPAERVSVIGHNSQLYENCAIIRPNTEFETIALEHDDPVERRGNESEQGMHRYVHLVLGIRVPESTPAGLVLSSTHYDLVQRRYAEQAAKEQKVAKSKKSAKGVKDGNKAKRKKVEHIMY